MHGIQGECSKTRNCTVCRHAPASFSLEIVQAGAVKGLNTDVLVSKETPRKKGSNGLIIKFIPMSHACWHFQSIRRFETSRAKLEGEERALAAQLSKQLKMNDQMRIKG